MLTPESEDIVDNLRPVTRSPAGVNLSRDGRRSTAPRRQAKGDNGSLNRSELQVQFLEAPKQESSVPFEPTIACRTVLSL